jgi:DNA polymerase-3 subunit beta
MNALTSTEAAIAVGAIPTPFMHFHAECAALLDAVAFLNLTMDKKTGIPILTHILFPGDGRMVGTDLDQEATWLLSAGVEHYPFTVSLKSLQTALKGANRGCLVRFDIDAEKQKVVVTADGMTSNLDTLPTEDFPRMVEPAPYPMTFYMQAPTVYDWLSFVAPCISTEETRYYLNGIFIHPRLGKLCAVATDGHRLGIKDTAESWEANETREFNGHGEAGKIMPALAVKTILAGIGKKAKGGVDICISKKHIEVAHADWTLRTRVVDGTFPDYTRVIPQDGKHALGMNIEQAIKAVTRMQGVMGKHGGAMWLDPTESVFSCKNSGEPTSMAMHFINPTGDGFGINPAYLKECLTAWKDAGHDNVYLHWETGGPVRFDPKASYLDYQEGLRVCMPMRY